MRASQELNYLYHTHPLLREIEDRDIALAAVQRKLAAAEGKIEQLRESNRRLNAARRAAVQEASRGKI